MSHDFKEGSPFPTQQDSEVLTLLKKMQEQLVFLERKIDTLVNQSAPKPSAPSQKFSEDFKKKQHFTKPFSPRGKFNYGEKKQEGHFGGGKPSFGKKKFFGPRKDR